MGTRKDRRHSGRKYAKLVEPLGALPDDVRVHLDEVYYSEWDNWRDGFRDWRSLKSKDRVFAEKLRRKRRRESIRNKV